CRYVDAVAVDVVALDDDVAEVDADAETDQPVVRHALVAHGHLALDVGRALHGIDDAAEFDQRAVAHQLDHAPAMLCDRGIDELAPARLQPLQRAALVGAHEPAVADHVGGKYGGQPPLHASARSPGGRRHARPFAAVYTGTCAMKAGSFRPAAPRFRASD